VIDIAGIEAFVVEVLNPLEVEENVAIVAFPDGANYPRVATAGFAIVAFLGERLDPPNGRNQGRGYAQNRTVQFEISLHLKDLRSHSGAYPIIDRMRDLLTGQSPPGCKPRGLYVASSQYADRINGFWIYRIVAEIDLPLIHRNR